MPAVFVLIWSTGFIVARFGMPHAPPLKFLAVRYALSMVCFLVWVDAGPASRGRAIVASEGHLAVIGVLMQAGYLGGVWAAVRAGMGSGPGRAAGRHAAGADRRVAVSMLGGRITRRQWTGLLLGFGRPGAGGVAQARAGRGGQRTDHGAGLAGAAVDHRRHAVPEAFPRALRRPQRQRDPDGRSLDRDACRWRRSSPTAFTGTWPRAAPWRGRCSRCRWAAVRCSTC